MWEVVEHAQVAAPLGRVWQVVRGLVPETAVDVDEPRELAWTSRVPVDDADADAGRIEVHWWFRLAPSWRGTDLEHGCRRPRPSPATDDTDDGRAGGAAVLRVRLVATLAGVKARAEA
jgi:hypothetical protein